MDAESWTMEALQMGAQWRWRQRRHVLPAEVVVRVRRGGARGAVRLALEQVLRVRVERQLHRRRVCGRRVRARFIHMDADADGKDGEAGLCNVHTVHLEQRRGLERRVWQQRAQLRVHRERVDAARAAVRRVAALPREAAARHRPHHRRPARREECA